MSHDIRWESVCVCVCVHLIIHADSTMCGYAVDINGELVDGVVVEVRKSDAT